jgi:hypothetical protein
MLPQSLFRSLSLSCTAVLPHSNIILFRIRLLKLASSVCFVFRSPSPSLHYHILLFSTYSCSPFSFSSPIRPYFIYQLILYPRSLVRTTGVYTLISKLQQNCWINTDQLGNVPKEQTLYRHVINKIGTARGTKCKMVL